MSCNLEHSQERPLIHCITEDCYRRRYSTTNRSAVTLPYYETQGLKRKRSDVCYEAVGYLPALDLKIKTPRRKSRNVKTLHKPCHKARNSKSQVRLVIIIHHGSVFPRKYLSATSFSRAQINHIKIYII